MSTITDQLFALGKELITNKPEVTNALYAAADDGGVESETGEFLYGLVRLLKPIHILETGTYTGISAMYMAQGLKDNARRETEKLVTVEVSETHKIRAEKLWQATDLSDYIHCVLANSLTYTPLAPVELLFLDSEPHLRFTELIKFFPTLKPGGYALIHDLFGHLGQGGPINPDHPDMPNWPFGTLPEQIQAWLQADALRIIPLPAPRGLVLFYKTKEGDYRV